MKLIDLVYEVTADVEFYQDILNDEALFAEFTMGNGITYFDRLESNKFKSFLRMRSLEVTDDNQTINADAAIQYIRDHFAYQEKATKVDVFIRTAGNLTDGIEYALKDDKQRVVAINKEGWELTTEPSSKFLRSSTANPQVIPEECDDSPIKLLKPYVNLRGDSLKLFVIWLIQAFCSGNHSALLVTAERGSGKSTLARIIRTVLEPSSVDISHFSTKKEELLNTLSNLYLVCFDNVRNITQEQSDLLCSAITGGTATKRALYTNNDLYVQKLHNTVVINGISVCPQESDLAERFLVVQLKKLTSTEICRERDFWDSFNNDLPYILGAIFKTLSKAMTHFETLSFENMPRMADAFADMVAIAMALGISEELFRKISDDNVELMHKLRADTPLIEAVRETMNGLQLHGRRELKGKAERVYSIVRDAYSGNKNNLPNGASAFSRALELEHDALFAAGFRVNINDMPSDGTEIQILRKKK